MIQVEVLQHRPEHAKQFQAHKARQTKFALAAQRLHEQTRAREIAKAYAFAMANMPRRVTPLPQPPKPLQKMPQSALTDLRAVVLAKFGVKYRDFISSSARRKYTIPRMLFCHIAKEVCPQFSSGQIGKQIGGRDPTTILHAAKRGRELVESDPTIAEIYQQIVHSEANFPVCAGRAVF